MSRNTNDLLDLLASLTNQNKAQDNAQKAKDAAYETMSNRGISDDNVRTFQLVHSQVTTLATALALSVTLNHYTGHLPACAYGLATVDFLRGATAWMYDVLAKAQINPSVFGMRDTPDVFYVFLGGEADKFNRTIAQHAEDEDLLRQLFDKGTPSRAACE